MLHPPKDRFKDLNFAPGEVVKNCVADKKVLDCRIVRDEVEILSLEKDWQTLEVLCPNTVLFQSFDWCCNYLDFRRENSNADDAFKPIIVAIYAGGSLIGLLPLCLQQKGRMVVLTGFSEPFQQYTEILLRSNCDLDGVRGAFLKALKATGADYFHFGQVRQDGALAGLLADNVPPSGERDGAPYVALKEFDDFESYLKTIKTKTRKNMRNARNRLERDGAIVHDVGRDGALMAGVVKRAFEGREAWLERLGITSRAFRDDDFEGFLKHCTGPNAVKGVDAIAMALGHGGTPISDQWGFVYRGRYYAFMATWNEDYEAASPGRMHLGEVIKACFEEGIETADFMIPASSYKMTWTKNAAPVQDYVLPISKRGKLYTKLWLDLARPISKRLFFKLSPGIRGLLVKKVLPSVE